MRAGIGIAAISALAACSQPSDQAPADPAQAPEIAIPVEPDGGIGDGAIGPEAAEALANRIPTRFHGVWDYVEGTCDPISDLRMEITAGEIMFYESIGLVLGMDTESEDVIVTLAMEGEGETWEQKTRLSLVGEGSDQKLYTSDGEQPKVANNYPLKRCS